MPRLTLRACTSELTCDKQRVEIRAGFNTRIRTTGCASDVSGRQHIPSTTSFSKVASRTAGDTIRSMSSRQMRMRKMSRTGTRSVGGHCRATSRASASTCACTRGMEMTSLQASTSAARAGKGAADAALSSSACHAVSHSSTHVSCDIPSFFKAAGSLPASKKTIER